MVSMVPIVREQILTDTVRAISPFAISSRFRSLERDYRLKALFSLTCCLRRLSQGSAAVAPRVQHRLLIWSNYGSTVGEISCSSNARYPVTWLRMLMNILSKKFFFECYAGRRLLLEGGHKIWVTAKSWEWVDDWKGVKPPLIAVSDVERDASAPAPKWNVQLPGTLNTSLPFLTVSHAAQFRSLWMK